MPDSHKRTLAKTLMWRLSGILLFMVLTWIATGDIMFGIELGVGYNIIRAVQYYITERLWARIRWGNLDRR